MDDLFMDIRTCPTKLAFCNTKLVVRSTNLVIRLI
jgi:hypothetical protein